MHLQRLPYTQIQHNLLATARDGISPDIAIQPLDLGTLTTSAIAQTTKDLAGLSRAEFERHSRLGLQAGDSPAELQHSLVVGHLLALVDQALHPRVRGLDLAGHMRELHADNSMIDEFLAESPALMSVFDALLVADAGEADALDDDADTLMVEVRHQDLESLVLLADEVLDGDFDVFESDVSCAGGPDTLAIHAAGANATHVALDEEGRDTVHAFAAGPHRGGEVVAPVCELVWELARACESVLAYQIPFVIHFFSPLTM